MTLLLEVAAFVLGAWLSIRMIAALHGAMDLWYDIGGTWLRVTGDVVFWEVVILVGLWLLERPYQAAFAWGFWTYIAFYLSLLPLGQFVISRARSDRRRD